MTAELRNRTMEVRDAQQLLNQLINVRALLVMLSIEHTPAADDGVITRTADVARQLVEDIYCNATNDETAPLRGWS